MATEIIQYGIARHIGGVTLNPYEFVLDSENEIMKFNSVSDCIEFMYNNTDELLTEEQWGEDGIYFVQLN